MAKSIGALKMPRLVAVGAAMTLIAGLTAMPSNAKTTRPGWQLVHGADQPVCQAVQKAHRRLAQRHPDVVYGEEYLNDAYAGTGITLPRPLGSDDPLLVKYPGKLYGHPLGDGEPKGDGTPTVLGMVGDAPASAIDQFYNLDVAGDGQKHLIYLHYTPFGHGRDFQTELWIFRPGVPYRPIAMSPLDERFGTQFDDKDVALHFSEEDGINVGRKHNYQNLYDPNLHSEDKILKYPGQDEKKIGEFAILLRNNQHVIMFLGKIYIVAGMSIDNYIDVYRIMPSNQMRVDCEFR
ncbi:hypothetical protein [Azospirillum sp. B4]|uniref:hypothetical protein n=1 Tax=Azospirillum sp. B4 TaxID=95605 RepID=UPI0011DD8F3A|nr:hypothetical protein [Azospirillum sp. B4]